MMKEHYHRSILQGYFADENSILHYTCPTVKKNTSHDVLLNILTNRFRSGIASFLMINGW